MNLSLSEKHTRHFLLLDAARGVAALVIVFFHLYPVMGPHPANDHFLERGYLAVDLFFLMSGLVLTRAYERKILDRSMSIPAFFKVRLRRLWPVYFLGITLSYLFSLVNPELAPPAHDRLLHFLLNSVFLPDQWRTGILFPINLVAWSLFLEVAINIFYVLFLVRLPGRWLAVIGGLAGVLFMHLSLTHGAVDMGWTVETLTGGAMRISFSFILGIVLYRNIRTMPQRLPATLAPFLLLALTCLLLTPFGTPTVAYDLVCVFALIPAFVLLACLTETRAVLVNSCTMLGRLSYPTYMLHIPVLLWLSWISQLLVH